MALGSEFTFPLPVLTALSVWVEREWSLGYPSIPSWLIQTAVLGCQVDLMSPRGEDFSRS